MAELAQTRLRVGQPWSRGSILDRENYFSFLNSVQIGSTAHPAPLSKCVPEAL